MIAEKLNANTPDLASIEQGIKDVTAKLAATDRKHKKALTLALRRAKTVGRAQKLAKESQERAHKLEDECGALRVQWGRMLRQAKELHPDEFCALLGRLKIGPIVAREDMRIADADDPKAAYEQHKKNSRERTAKSREKARAGKAADVTPPPVTSAAAPQPDANVWNTQADRVISKPAAADPAPADDAVDAAAEPAPPASAPIAPPARMGVVKREPEELRSLLQMHPKNDEALIRQVWCNAEHYLQRLYSQLPSPLPTSSPRSRPTSKRSAPRRRWP
jgi:hypothetical protein